MSSILDVKDEPYFMRLIRDSLEAEVRAALKEPLMKQAEATVDEAVDRAVAMLKPRLESWMDEQYRELKVEILVNRVSPDKPT